MLITAISTVPSAIERNLSELLHEEALKSVIHRQVDCAPLVNLLMAEDRWHGSFFACSRKSDAITMSSVGFTNLCEDLQSTLLVQTGCWSTNQSSQKVN